MRNRTEATPNLSSLSTILTALRPLAPSISALPKCSSLPLLLSPQRFVARSLVSVVVVAAAGGKEEKQWQ